MPQKIEGEMRVQIAGFLPCALEKALITYKGFCKTAPPDEPKDFVAYQNGCKAAIAHVELLIKLAQWADLPDPDLADEAHYTMLRTMIENAEQELEGRGA